MTETVAFDTYRFVKSLMDTGFSERQAEVLVAQQVAFLDRNLATRGDIEGIKERIEALHLEVAKVRGETEKVRAETARVREETEKVRAETARVREETEKIRGETEKIKAETEKVKAEIQGLRLEVEKVRTEGERIKADLLKWMIGAMIAQMGLIVGLLRLT